MRRALLLLLFVALPLSAAQEKWVEAYNRGVKAVNTKNYADAAANLQKAIADMPNENPSARSRNEIFVYVPHFWLGIAKFNLGDVDGALREWKTSEDQGAIIKTDYYSKLRDWVARAQAERIRNAQSAAASSKNTADAALSRALAGQMQALSSGGDRTDNYRAANRKLQEALALFNSAGTDIKTYERAAAIAGDARGLFERAAEEGKKMKAARPVVVRRQPAPQRVAPAPVPVPTTTTAEAAVASPKTTATAETVVAPPAAPPQQTTTIAEVVIAPKEEPPVLVATATVPIPAAPQALKHSAPTRAQLEWAYRAFATGDLASSERALTSILDGAASGEAYLLRGCARYTRAMLSRTPDPLLAAAKSDFKAALKLNRALRLDRNAFSPKLIAFFEEVRRGG